MSSENRNNLKVAVGMSGGVDSSVAAYLLKEQGYDVTGVFMRCWEAKADGCEADEDRSDAVAVASKLGIKFKALDFTKEYKDCVIDYFYKEYESGRTPNPDIMCNKEIKFGIFLDWAEKNGFDYVATGHYARIVENNGVYKLLRGVDETKSQSYFLYALGQKELSKTLFPLGGMTKDEVRDRAEKVGLPTYDKPDSVGICFIGEVDIKEFLKKRIDLHKGNVIKDDEVVGEHEGVEFYTIGQRHGFNINKYMGLPVYVIDKNIEKNELIVGFSNEATRGKFNIKNPTWIKGSTPDLPMDCDVRIRHLGEMHSAHLSPDLEVTLDDPIFGVAPGQSAVFYLDDEVVGGGIIS